MPSGASPTPVRPTGHNIEPAPVAPLPTGPGNRTSAPGQASLPSLGATGRFRPPAHDELENAAIALTDAAPTTVAGVTALLDYCAKTQVKMDGSLFPTLEDDEIKSVDLPFLYFVCKNAGQCCGPAYALVRHSIDSIKVASSLSAFELLTRFDTGHFCRRSFGAGLRSSTPASPRSHGSKSSSASRTAAFGRAPAPPARSAR